MYFPLLDWYAHDGRDRVDDLTLKGDRLLSSRLGKCIAILAVSIFDNALQHIICGAWVPPAWSLPVELWSER